MRTKIAAGNWKMNTTLSAGVELAREINALVTQVNVSETKKIMIAPPFTHLFAISQVIDNEKIILGAQNLAAYEKGAYTGEISAEMLNDVNAKFVIIGHSERRAYFNETDDVLLKKIEIALKYGLQPVFCIGEKLEQREAGNHFEIVQKQLEQVIFKLNTNDFEKIIIAYEPVWAIGTGKTASPEQAQEMHAFIRKLIKNQYNNEIAENTTLLYGGSVKPANAGQLFAQPDVDGGLIGGASLKANDFIEIYKNL